MKNHKINGEVLKSIGFTQGKSVGLALRAIENSFDSVDDETILALLPRIMKRGT